MLIEYKMTGNRRTVPDAIGARLVKQRLAREVYETRDLVAEPAKEPEPAPDPEVSPRTGKPKRKYRRRDMQAED